jgi:hypothetical protein
MKESVLTLAPRNSTYHITSINLSIATHCDGLAQTPFSFAYILHNFTTSRMGSGGLWLLVGAFLLASGLVTACVGMLRFGLNKNIDQRG